MNFDLFQNISNQFTQNYCSITIPVKNPVLFMSQKHGIQFVCNAVLH